jgi:hypothetical protein
MKKLLIPFILLLLLVGIASAAKTTDPCKYIKDGTIQDKFGATIGLGYNQWGYNYEAHMFNGMYCDAYGSADWCQQFKDVKLMMKWNDAWLSNKDCGTQGPDQGAFTSTTPDHVLDRHYPTANYIGSGAWLTNHAIGTYTSTAYKWDVTRSYVIDVEYLGTDYAEDLILTQTGSSIAGVSLELVGGGSLWTIDTGAVIGNAISFDGYFVSSPSMRVHFEGIIASDGSMSGTWNDIAPGTRTGSWATTSGTASKVYETCTVSDFVKIVAAPADATLIGNMWYASDGTEIGPAIWGSFAIIQEFGSDPCEEYGVIDYLSPLRVGLGNW